MRISRRWFLPLAIATACGASETTSGFDAAVGAADFASASTDDGDGGGCAQSLSSWCAHLPVSWARCIETLPQATMAATWSNWCGPGGGAARVAQEACGAHYTGVAQSDADTGFIYLYDTSTNALTAVIAASYQGTLTCVAGPSGFVQPTCSASFTTICP